MLKKLAKIRPYYKYELTELYEISIKTFMKRLYFILDELEDTGYKKTQKILSLKQVEIIFQYMGHPFANNTSGIECKTKAPLYAYRKSELAKLYNISEKTLLIQIKAIPYIHVTNEIMDANNGRHWKRQVDKNNFKRKEVKLIFEYLGHPTV